MKKYLYILTVFSAFLLFSCAEDRTHEYDHYYEHNIWMFDVMSDKYLFADKFSEQSWKDYFSTPSNYFKKLIEKGTDDNASYIVIDTLAVDPQQRGHFNHISSYGFDFLLMSDPTGSTTKSYARVTTVYPDSPAERAGLKRNDFIESYSGIKITTNNLEKLENGPKITLTVKRLYANTETSAYEWESEEKISLSTSEPVDDKPFPIYKVFNIQNNNIGYLMCNQLVESSTEGGNSSGDNSQQLDNIISYFRQKDINNLVLDLRLCNFGTYEMSRKLASYIIPSNSLDKVYSMTFWNENNKANNESATFDTSLSGKTLDLDFVYVITSAYTKGAAEWLINGLKFALGADNVVIVGTKTAGQNMMTQNIGDYNDVLHLYPAVAYISDGSGDYSLYTSGIEPTIEADEMKVAYLYDYGLQYEYLLQTALTHMFTEE